eukprot:scaffold12214_cov159-Amphora_coffeaeformis.AAC.5
MSCGKIDQTSVSSNPLHDLNLSQIPALQFTTIFSINRTERDLSKLPSINPRQSTNATFSTMTITTIKDRTTIRTKDHGSPVQVDNDALLGAASKDKHWQKLRKKTAHIGRKTQDPKWHGVPKIET